MLRGDPLNDVRDLQPLKTTYRDGIAYNPQQLIADAPSTCPMVWINV